jgi:hypothetical protein
VVAPGMLNLPVAAAGAMFDEGAPVLGIESSWLEAVVVHPATHTLVMAAMVVVALVAQTTVVAKEAEDTEGHRAMVEPPVGVVPLLSMAAVAAEPVLHPVVLVQPALATVLFPAARAPWVKVEQVTATAAQVAASQVPAVAIMAAVALPVVTAVPAVVAVARLGRARSANHPSLPATLAMDL